MIKHQFIPWLLALGFAFLFLSTFFINDKSLQYPLNSSTSSVPQVSTQSEFVIPDAVVVVVTRVIDGDTVELSNRIRIRLIGIDTPETGSCYSLESANALENLVEGKNVTIEKDVQEKDKYGRTLAYIYVGDLFINEKMLEDGYAKLLTIPPDVKYVEKFTKAQATARENKRGIWSNNECDSTSDVERVETNYINSQGNSECTIKGNISAAGEKIYHSPGQRYYEKTKIEESLGEKWFCTEKEAQEAGWRKSKV